jgi:2-polyprenyl-3-methyl-5-hydroxy-6-metoxy-1,4-benzoquinol methylase
MIETIEACPVCDCKEQKLYLTCRDHTVSGEEFKVKQCSACGFRFTSPRPAQAAIGKYYQSENYVSHSGTSKGLINKLYLTVRRKTLMDKLNLINQLHPRGTLLDVGCGTGDFLKACQDRGWMAKGIEADAVARQKAQENSGVEVKEDLLTAFKARKFDVITLWHVLEHLHQLEESIIRLKQLLDKEGVLVVAVPNSDSLDARLYHEHWAAYDVPRHLYHFDQHSMALLLEKHGLKIAGIKPMKFDAFYISLLSTKYKYGQTRYVESVKNGLYSNLWAARNGKNYSSITYIITQ